MKNKVEAPAVHIAIEHQSAPAKSWADIEVEKAAEEIRTGQFKPDMSAVDYFDCGTDLVAQHPRVIAALARLETEKSDAKTTQEMLEKTQMLFEMNARTAHANQWNGQVRWLGKYNEGMRIGKILTPLQFLERLEAVIGVGRIFLNRFAVNKRVALLAPDRDLKDPTLILLPGQTAPQKQSGQVQVGTLQWPCGTEWMIVRFDEYGVPTTAKYLGWRTALLSMIRLGVVSEKEAHQAFPLGTGPASAWYREQLFILRSQRGTVQ
jgi:hypothetical protein